MKHLSVFIFVLFSFITTETNAQGLRFIDTSGDEVVNGTTLAMNEASQTPFGVEVPLTGVSITGASNAVLTATVENLPASSTFQCCVGESCRNISTPGSIVINNINSTSGAVKIINTEWCPTTYGNCLVKFSLRESSSESISSEIYVNFVYANPSSIDVISSTDNLPDEKLYNLNGQRISESTKGIIIKDGKKFVNN